MNVDKRAKNIRDICFSYFLVFFPVFQYGCVDGESRNGGGKHGYISEPIPSSEFSSGVLFINKTDDRIEQGRNEIQLSNVTPGQANSLILDVRMKLAGIILSISSIQRDGKTIFSVRTIVQGKPVRGFLYEVNENHVITDTHVWLE
jgi:hypothetical protein